MVSLKSHVKRRFKPEQYPENVCFCSNKIICKFDKINLDKDEEVLIIIDNEPDSIQIDGVVFTSERIIILNNAYIETVHWEEIKSYQLPKEKKVAGFIGEDPKMARNDKITLHLRDGREIMVRLIYGGVYQLASLLNNIKHIELRV